ncbi:hypothetical protein TSMEX_008476 [Taenia solium]|eukprot:TsM_001182500 transcript=TsM_001182500 gene=TsM_001182500
MLALKLQIFDSKEYTLFYHSVSGGEFNTTASFSQPEKLLCQDASSSHSIINSALATRDASFKDG